MRLKRKSMIAASIILIAAFGAASTSILATPHNAVDPLICTIEF